MYFWKRIATLMVILSSLWGAYAKLDLNSTSNVVVYWGQNSFNGKGELAQQSLGYYCNDDRIDVIVLAFLVTINGQGGAPVFDLANANDNCTTFEGTNLLKCPQMGTDITRCQKKGKTIIMSIGGATYSEGGFQSESAAQEGAELIWKTFGPPAPALQGPFLNASSIRKPPYFNASSHYGGARTNRTNRYTAWAASKKAYRPFGNATIDGFDFDFESSVENIAPFANRLRKLSDADTSRKYYLTAAPQCPYPDVAGKDILHGSVSVDAIFVQFYNNWCGVNSFEAGQQTQNSFNFEQWDKWAKKVSQNKNAKVLLGVPANKKAASTGYIPASKLAPVIAYSKSFESFGGVMMWDVTQAYGNEGFLDGVTDALENSTSHTISHGYRLPTILR
ncbi:glycoside hydrolase superfamily [Aspergillus avenaceus]|uniref:chitinase n=1 Tax=Aspergillus avenaceus TaxID=36643 RepID=A0A5N6TUS5_ASPAV|nr:glycoside hydrolase superfamily [Aspergillus avenaceus]